MDPHPVIVTIGDNRDYIRVLLYSYYTTITGWGVLLKFRVHLGLGYRYPRVGPKFCVERLSGPKFYHRKVIRTLGWDPNSIYKGYRDLRVGPTFRHRKVIGTPWWARILSRKVLGSGCRVFSGSTRFLRVR